MGKFNAISINDTQELRKRLQLPITKDLIYMKQIDAKTWKSISIIDYVIVDTYYPSKTDSVLVTLETGEKIRILSDYLSEMNKSNFIESLNIGISEE